MGQLIGVINGVDGPIGLAIDRASNVYVSATFTNTIDAFSSSGQSLGVFASTGLDDAVGLAFDATGNLFAANFFSGTIEKFSPAGVDLGPFATGIQNPGDLVFSL